jgi:hypothetical protein
MLKIYNRVSKIKIKNKMNKNLESILNEPMLSNTDLDCVVLNDEQSDEIYGGKGKIVCGGNYGNCTFGNCS